MFQHHSLKQLIISLLEQAVTQISQPKQELSIPPTPIDLGVKHDSQWVYAATREGRKDCFQIK